MTIQSEISALQDRIRETEAALVAAKAPPQTIEEIQKMLDEVLEEKRGLEQDIMVLCQEKETLRTQVQGNKNNNRNNQENNTAEFKTSFPSSKPATTPNKGVMSEPKPTQDQPSKSKEHALSTVSMPASKPVSSPVTVSSDPSTTTTRSTTRRSSTTTTVNVIPIKPIPIRAKPGQVISRRRSQVFEFKKPLFDQQPAAPLVQVRKPGVQKHGVQKHGVQRPTAVQSVEVTVVRRSSKSNARK